MSSRARHVVAVLLSVGVAAIGLPVVLASHATAAAPPPAAEQASGERVALLAGPTGAHSYVPPLVTPGQVGTQSVSIVVNYDSNFNNPANAAAKAAFQYAVDLWAQLLTSTVPIEINAFYDPLPTGVLGSSGPHTVEADGCPAMTTAFAATWYPAALANAVCGTDLSPGQAEADAEININFAQWYFGLDGHPAGNQYDFVSVVLHELGHSLGFIGSMDVNGSTGSWGDCCNNPGPTQPFVYDQFTMNGAGQALISPPGPFANNSTALGNQLRSFTTPPTSNGGVFFGGLGTNTNAANGGNPAQLWAPNSWQGGSSFSHLSDTTYPTGNANSLMTPSLSGGEAIHSPGPVVLAMFKDMGWTLPDPPGTPAAPTATAGSSAAKVAFGPPLPDDGGSAVTSYTVTATPGTATGTGPASPVYVAGLTNGTSYTFTVKATNPFGTGLDSAASNAVTPRLQGFHALTPKRILDTRTGVIGANARNTPLGPQENASVQVTGFTGSALAGAEAVVMNVTAVNPTKAGWLTIWPTGAVPTASNLNFAAGQTVPNLVTVELGPSGTVRLGNTIGSGAAGSTNVIFDVVGWYESAVPTGGGEQYQSIAPTRILDTRFGTSGQCPLCNSRASALGPQETYTVPVANVGGVPPGAVAVAMNVTAVTPSKAGWLTIWPSGAMPTASNLNFVAGQTVANLVVVMVGAGNTVKLGNTVGGAGAGSTHVIFDVVGWYGPGAAGGGLNAVTPARILDTRFGVAGANGRIGALAPQEQATIQVAGFGGVPSSGVSAVVINVTATGSTKSGWLTIWPGGTIPSASNLNFPAGKTVPNLVVVGLDPGTGTVKVGNTSGSANAGFTHVIFDVVGWFASP